jgi:hypothetical protein
MRRVVEFTQRKGTAANPEHPTIIPALLPVSRYVLVEAERVTRLCGTGVPFRPLFIPRSVVLCSGGRRPSLSPTGQNFPDEAVSIRKVASYVKQKSNPVSGKPFVFPSHREILFEIAPGKPQTIPGNYQSRRLK